MAPEDKLIERLLQRIDKINKELIEVIGASIKRIGTIKPSQVYQIQQELKYGESLQELVDILEKIGNINQKDIIEILEAVAKKDQEFRKVYYEARNKDYIPYSSNEPLQRIVQEVGMTTLNAYKNISRTSGLTYLDSMGNRITKPLIQAYWDIVDDAVLKVSTGQVTFDQAMKEQIKTFAGSGIQSIEYDSGYHKRIDSAIRTNMEEALRQMTIAQNEIVGEQFNYDAMEVSVHMYPAPDHEDIQGHIFDLDNWKKLQDYTYIGDIKDVKGRVFTRDGGNPIRAIATLNCKHIGYSTIKEAKPRYSEEQLNQIKERNKEGFELDGKHYTLYEGTQMQRQLEQRIRDEKNIQVGARASGDNDLAQESQGKINKLTDKYSELCKKSGLPSYVERLSVSGYRKIKVSDKTIKPEYKELNDNDYKIMEQKTLDLKSKLTSDEIKSLNNYTLTEYKDINTVLASSETDSIDLLTYSNIDDVYKDIQNIDSAINKSVIDKDIIVFKGTKSGYFEEIINNDIKEFEIPTYLSTTGKESISQKFARNVNFEISGSYGTILKIKIPKETKGIYLGDMFNENGLNEFEILLGRNNKYKIINHKWIDPSGYENGIYVNRAKQLIIELEVIK